MSKTKIQKKENFIPFIHDELQIKQELLQIARNNIEGDNKETYLSIQKDLSSVLIYSNMTEYLAHHLLDSLNYYLRSNTYKNFSAILYIENTYDENKNMTLGNLTTELNKINFPDKINVIKIFDQIAKSRNKIFHNLAKSNLQEIQDLLQKDLPLIKKNTEDLISKIDIIYNGLNKILIK